MKRKVSGVLFFFYVWTVLFYFCFSAVSFAADEGGLPQIQDGDYTSAILINANTGEVLYEKNIHDQHEPASMVKMMLMLLVMEKLKDHSISLSDQITVSAKASKIGGSQAYLKQGEVFSLEDLMKAIVIHSANDASVAVAEHILGSTEGCVDLMNRRAHELGLKDTDYHSVDGLPPSKGEKPDFSSAYDLAMLGRELVKYPKILEWGSIQSTPFRDGKFILVNTNKLIGSFPGADGLKTGYYRAAGFCLTATASRDGLRMISVVVGAKTNKNRMRESARLLSIGFNMYKKVQVVRKGEAVSSEVSVSGAKVKSTVLVAADDFSTLVLRGSESSLTKSVDVQSVIEAPVVKGNPYGAIIVKNGEKEIGRVQALSQEDIPRANFFYRLISRFL
ncbi:MAG: D-alanyl-D-alanine carboxypeptidase family protein [bacterium]